MWHGDKDSNGYGRLRHAGRKVYPAHRLMYELTTGPIPDGLVIRHKCDNPPCINPAHLVAGTQVQNMADMEERGRAKRPRGSSHGRSKLTEDLVREARARYVPGKRGSGIKSLAREYGVALSTMRAALVGAHWSHVA